MSSRAPSQDQSLFTPSTVGKAALMRDSDQTRRKMGIAKTADDGRGEVGPGAGVRGSGSEPPVGGRSVLVVEDNPELARNLSRLVRLLGHDARTAFSGPDGLIEALRHPPDILLCDIGLPGMDGNDLARAFRAEASLSHARLIAMSGGDMYEDRDQTLAAGFDLFLPKPLTIEQLRQALQHDADGHPRS